MLVTVVAPTVEPVTLAEVKAHLRVTHADQDALIATYISAAREAVEVNTGRALAAGTYRWVSEDAIGAYSRLPLWPVATVTTVTYENAAGTRVAFTGHVLDGERSLLALVPPEGGSALSVTFTTVAGILPFALKAAIFLITEDLYRQAGGLIAGESVEVNPTVDRMLYPFRINLGV